MNIPAELSYSTDHEWVRRDPGTDMITIGITDFAQEALGDVVFFEAPDLGLVVVASDTFTEVESTKSVSDIYAPADGTIVAVNARLGDEPELLNSDPYGEGWICKIELSDPSQLDTLLDASAYLQLTEG
jgi:glycine cleavage system H protein